MAFENSPNLHGSRAGRIPFRTWFYQHRRLIWALAGVVFLLWAALFAFSAWRVIQPPMPGALEGCLVTPAGEPMITIVRIGTLTRPTYSDGCFFFFPQIPPGRQELVIATDSGEVRLMVTIHSDQATSLGTVTITP